MERETAVPRVDRPREWRSKLAIAVTGILLFETVTGLVIYFLPFSVPNQMMVVFHTVFGLLFLAPFFWYQWRHWRTYQRFSMTHSKLTGYIGLALSALCILSGVVLTWQALFGTAISYAWDIVHLCEHLRRHRLRGAPHRAAHLARQPRPGRASPSMPAAVASSCAPSGASAGACWSGAWCRSR